MAALFMSEFNYYAIIVKATKEDKDKRPKRYRYLAYDKTHAYKQYVGKRPQYVIDSKTFQKSIISIEPTTKEDWISTEHLYSVNELN